jgi:hypothetical protein
MRAPHATANYLSVIPQFCVCFTLRAMHAPCAARTAHSRFALTAAAPPCSIHVLSCFVLVLPLRACPDCALATRTPTLRTCADCPNECLYQFGSRSVQPFGRHRWIYSAARTHTHTHTNTHTHSVNAQCPRTVFLCTCAREV